MNEREVIDSSGTHLDSISRVAIARSKLVSYLGVLKLEVSDFIPPPWLRGTTVALMDENEVVLIACAIRTWDTVGDYYHGFLEPKIPRRSSLPPIDLGRCVTVRVAADGQWRDFNNDPALLNEQGE